MKARSFLAGALASSLLVSACGARSPRATAADESPDPPTELRPPPGTWIVGWPDLGAWSATGTEVAGSRDLFFEARPATLTLTPPKAQIPHRLHRPVE